MIPRAKIYYYSTLSFEILEQSYLHAQHFNIQASPNSSFTTNYFQVQFYLEALLKCSVLSPTKQIPTKLEDKQIVFNFFEIILCCFMKHNFNTFGNLVKTAFLFSAAFSKKLSFGDYSFQIKSHLLPLPCLKTNFKLSMFF
uniref:hypothetical protein n=1 Tax=Campylaephora sungminbooi TaxID=1896769 RepID=UPI002E77E742|nr:hypothetical protein BI106_mgp03 [Campylaephora sungminbooi]WQF69666.1 hypothetical protein [Campylaephora sungminbooi]